MTLISDSINWAIDFVSERSDGDLFPKVQEFEAILEKKADFISLVEGKPLTEFTPGPYRRFVVPKDEVSYRQATQIDPQDSILLSAIIHQFGDGIEARRLAKDIVFSYRFISTSDHVLFDNGSAWNDFWAKAYTLSKHYSNILYCDIADFYNQIYHHEVNNQLIDSGFPNQATKWIIGLIESTTAGVSRGVPIGPHPFHLVAEATLIPIDNSLVSAGINFIRYADDYIVFCDNKREAKIALATVATILDRPQRLMLQRHKTKFYKTEDFQQLCMSMIEERLINHDEADLLKIIQKYSGGNPYKTIFFSEISEEDWGLITSETLRRIIEEYISKTPTDYVRLSWFYRRLAQIGHPGAVEVSLDYLALLGPCFASICSYLASIQSIEPDKWVLIGERLLRLLDLDEVKSNEYFALLILSLFSKNQHIDHFTKLAKIFESSPPFVRREILLAAKTNSAYGWIRQYKESFSSMDPWQKLAFIYCCSGLPSDEKKFFINRWVTDRPFDKVLAKWSKSIQHLS